MITQVEKAVKTEKDDATELADRMIREYKHTRWVTNSEKIGKPDSLSAWFSVEDMENFLANVKANGGDGIRFYFASYPENYQALPQYAGRQTIVSVATRSKETKTGEIADKDIYIVNKGKAKILGGLNPRLCPPVCMPNSEGGMGDLGITIVDRGNKGMEIV